MNNLSVLNVVDLIISNKDKEVMEILEELTIRRSNKRKGKQAVQ